MADNVNIPNIDTHMFAGLNSSDQQKKILSYLYQLTEQLRFVLNNIDTENMTASMAQRIKDSASESSVSERIDESVQKAESNYKDMMTTIINTADTVTAAYTSAIDKQDQAIRTDVRANYALKSDVNQSIYQINTSIDQQASSITASVTRILNLENAVGGFTEEQFTNYIRFDQNGIELGRSDSEFKAQLTNTKLSFLQGANEIAYISNNTLFITDAHITGKLTIGSGATLYDWQPEPDGSISLTYREG